jgi:hypothetical protein
MGFMQMFTRLKQEKLWISLNKIMIFYQSSVNAYRKGKDYSKDLNVDGKIISESTLEK